LLGIALNAETPELFGRLSSQRSLAGRLSILETTLAQHYFAIQRLLLTRQNSFTCVRRFAVPQVILDAYFSQYADLHINFADLGTGIGVLPRQLNSRQVYENLGHDLIWPGGVPEFRQLPISAIYGVDRGPMPDLQWVHACYGQSRYYSDLYEELLLTLTEPEIRNATVSFQELDLLDVKALDYFIRANSINAANLTYVLYELDQAARRNIIDTVIGALSYPGILMVTEPSEELHRQGCVVEIYHNGSLEPTTFCFVSDGHFKGYVLPLDDYESFLRRYPICYRREEAADAPQRG
jgi:hypothetical protein